MVRLVRQTSVPNTDLLTQYRLSGSPEIFAQITRAYGGMVYSVCLKVTRDPADAEDASQAAFLTLAVQCKTGTQINFLGSWLKKVAKRTALDIVRSRKRRNRRETVSAQNRSDIYEAQPGTPQENGEIHKIIREELDKLPAKYRMPLVLHYFGNLAHEELAREMRCTTATLGVRLHRARKMLGQRLTTRGITLEATALGIAIAAAVQHVVTHRFIEGTTLAASQIGYGAPVLSATLHSANIANLVSHVAQTMSQAKLRAATLAMALATLTLGGAAEVAHHFPDSLRPRIDLSPSNLINRIIDSLTPTRVMENNAPLPPVPVKQKADPMDLPLIVAIQPVSPVVPQIPGVTPTPPVLPRVQVVIDNPTRFVLPNNPTTPGSIDLQHHTYTPPVPPPVVVSNDSNNKPTPVISVASGSPSGNSPAKPTTDDPDKSSSDTTNLGAMLAAGGGGSSITGSSQSLDHYIPAPASFISSQNIQQSNALKTYDPTFSTSAHAASVPTVKQPAIAVADTTHAMPGGDGQSVYAASANNTTKLSTGQTTSNIALPVAAGSSPDTFPASINSGQVAITAGDGSYDWFNAEQGMQSGGINSVRFSVNDALNDGVVSIETMALNTIAAPPRPTGHHFIGIWSFDTTTPIDAVTLNVSYDYLLSDEMGLIEKNLKLWYSNGDNWVRITDASFVRDLNLHTLQGTATDFRFFAVSAPEPTGLFCALTTAAYTLLRRRQKTR